MKRAPEEIRQALGQAIRPLRADRLHQAALWLGQREERNPKLRGSTLQAEA
jgi:hypothetical protein